MKIEDEELLKKFRSKPACEWCKKKSRVVPHHLYCRGMGGGGQVDIPKNLISLCWFCHDLFHAGNIKRFALEAIVAEREGCQQADIRAEVNRIRNLPKSYYTETPNGDL